MKRRMLTLVKGKSLAVSLLVLAVVLPGRAYCQDGAVALLLQQTPVQGGTVTPGVGIHHFSLDAQVALTAIAKPGYRFVFWLGDVTEHTAIRTMAYLDRPKIIIAVFEPLTYQAAAGESASVRGKLGAVLGADLIDSSPDYSRSGWSDSGSGGGGGDEEGDTPPIPEPTTLLLLACGGVILLRRR